MYEGRRTMKKLLSVMMVLILLMAIAGCAKTPEKVEETTTPATSSKNETETPSTNDNTETDPAMAEEETMEPVTIKYMTFSAAPDHIAEIDAMIAAFNEVYPHITIEYETAAYGDYFTKLQSQIAGDVAPDTFELNYETFVTYASKGVLLNMDEQIAADDTYDPSVYNQAALEAFQYGGSQYGLVESFSNVVLFYNKELFDAAGVDYPSPEWTWADELEAAQKLTNADAGVYGSFSPIQFWEFYKTIEQNGGQILSDDKTEVVINSPQNVETLQWMIDKINKYGVTPSDAQMSGQSDGDMFKAGKIAMLRTGIWMFSSFSDADFEWDIALEPGNTNKAHHFFSNGVAISAKTEHPYEAWLWSRFMTSSDAATMIRVDANWELPAVTNDDVLAAYLENTPPMSKHVVFDALDTLVVPPVIENWNALTDAVGKELDEAKLGMKTPQEALDAAKEALEALIQ